MELRLKFEIASLNKVYKENHVTLNRSFTFACIN